MHHRDSDRSVTHSLSSSTAVTVLTVLNVVLLFLAGARMLGPAKKTTSFRPSRKDTLPRPDSLTTSTPRRQQSRSTRTHTRTRTSTFTPTRTQLSFSQTAAATTSEKLRPEADDRNCRMWRRAYLTLEIAFVVEACLFGKDFSGPDGGERERDGDPGHAHVDPGAEVGVVGTGDCCYC